MVRQEEQPLAANLVSANIPPIVYPLDTSHPWIVKARWSTTDVTSSVLSYNLLAAVAIPSTPLALIMELTSCIMCGKKLPSPLDTRNYFWRIWDCIYDSLTAKIAAQIAAAQPHHPALYVAPTPAPAPSE